MEPNFELIVKGLFGLSKGEKVDYFDLSELSLTDLDSCLGNIAKLVYPDYNVPDEVCDFIDKLVNYIERNHIIE